VAALERRHAKGRRKIIFSSARRNDHGATQTLPWPASIFALFRIDCGILPHCRSAQADLSDPGRPPAAAAKIRESPMAMKEPMAGEMKKDGMMKEET